jgi:hypothetical protein
MPSWTKEDWSTATSLPNRSCTRVSAATRRLYSRRNATTSTEGADPEQRQVSCFAATMTMRSSSMPHQVIGRASLAAIDITFQVCADLLENACLPLLLVAHPPLLLGHRGHRVPHHRQQRQPIFGILRRVLAAR